MWKNPAYENLTVMSGEGREYSDEFKSLLNLDGCIDFSVEFSFFY